MKYIFEKKITDLDNEKVIEIPFNVWEVQENIGDYPVEATINDITFKCNLLPKRDGYYYLPLSEANADFEKETIYPVSFTILTKPQKMSENSPYSLENPIRKIDGIKIITQPWDGLCGQTCIAMLADITLAEANNIMHCREWQANMGKIILTLDYLGINHANQIIYTQGKECELPKCAIIMEKMGRFSHYLICYDGVFYDPTDGILDEFDLANMKGYLEIL